MVTLDRITEMVCLEDVEDRYVDMYLNANPGMLSADALEDNTVVDQPGNDVDILAGAPYEGDAIEIPDEDGFTPSAYDALVAADKAEIADEDVPEESELYDDDDDEDDTLVTDEELMAADTVDDMLEMSWQRGQSKTFWESAPEPQPMEEGTLAKKVYDKMKKKNDVEKAKGEKRAAEIKKKKKELGYGGAIGYSLGKAANAATKPLVNFGKGVWKGIKGESSLLTPEEMEEATRTLAPEEYDNFFEMDASAASRDIYSEADEIVAKHEEYMQPVTFSQIAEQDLDNKDDPNPTGNVKVVDPGKKPMDNVKSDGYK